MVNVVLFGASGHGSVVLDSLEKSGHYHVLGFLDTYKKKGSKLNGYEVLGSEYDLPYLTDAYNIQGGVIAIGDNYQRELMMKRILKIQPGFRFVSAIHPSAIIGKDVQIGEGTVIMPGAVVNSNSFIGKHCIINTNASLGHDGYMGHFSSLASGVCTGGNLRLGRSAAISIGTVTIQNISIGDHTIIGAGSLVLHSFGNNLIAYGAPAKVVRSRKPGEKYLNGSSDRSVLL